MCFVLFGMEDYYHFTLRDQKEDYEQPIWKILTSQLVLYQSIDIFMNNKQFGFESNQEFFKNNDKNKHSCQLRIIAHANRTWSWRRPDQSNESLVRTSLKGNTPDRYKDMTRRDIWMDLSHIIDFLKVIYEERIGNIYYKNFTSILVIIVTNREMQILLNTINIIVNRMVGGIRLIIGTIRNIKAFFDSLDVLIFSVRHYTQIQFSLDIDSLQISSSVKNLALQTAPLDHSF